MIGDKCKKIPSPKKRVFLWRAYGPCVIWEKGDEDENKRGLWIIPLEYQRYYDSRLDVAKEVLLGKKFICDIEEKGRKYGSKLYFDYSNKKWLMNIHVSCWCLILH